MTTPTYKTLTLSRPGGGSLKIHPSEWAALSQAVTNALQLDADPAVSLEDLPLGAQREASPLGNSRQLIARFDRYAADRPMSGRYEQSVNPVES
ncbi:hypothetical protein [Chromohalobacter sp. HP20-39]|uniref:hypothetical protein n=1 Tax=Chromohalobacter sp. HP20-39 TaxID=3079306 RepID=UPI00294B58C6|nr:hypothetical protein [Chromohalobacter sp. HP20-39]MDV6319586.1 hypothetical protein [Chromohalobacter sp. HP20-39]